MPESRDQPSAAVGRARHAMQLAGVEYETIVDSLLDPWVLLEAVRDGDGRIVDFAYRANNIAACRANRMTREELLGATLLTVLPQHADNGLFEAYAAVVETGEPLALDDYAWSSPLTGGAVRWFDNRAVRVGDGISFTWRDVTERYEARAALAYQAGHDTLTGLVNRAELADRMQQVMSRQPRAGTRVAVLFCDLDDFKVVNDTYGHATGDAVLQQVAERLRGAVRSGDVVARLGGDEFVVVLDGLRDEADAHRVGEHVARAVAAPMALAGTADPVVVTMGVGIAIASEGDEPDRVLREADAALYRAKELRRNG